MKPKISLPKLNECPFWDGYDTVACRTWEDRNNGEYTHICMGMKGICEQKN